MSEPVRRRASTIVRPTPALYLHAAVVVGCSAATMALLLPEADPNTPDANIGGGLAAQAVRFLGLPWSLPLGSDYQGNDDLVVALVCLALFNVVIHWCIMVARRL